MRYAYERFGTVALIYEDGKAICVAKLEADGCWVAKTNPMIGHEPRFYQMPPLNSDRCLDTMIANLNRNHAVES